MSHQTEIVGYEKISNGQFAVYFRCCGNALTEYRHTMAGTVMADPKKRKASIKAARLRTAKEHDDALKAEEAGIEIMGKKETHP